MINIITNTKMKNLKLFMPNRQVFMASPEKGGEGEKQEPKVPGAGGEFTPGDAKLQAAKLVGGNMGMLDQAQQLDDQKPKVEQKEPISDSELKQMSKGYPEVTVNANNQAIINVIKDKFKKDNANKHESYQVMGHRDTGNAFDGDGYEYVLVMDAHHNPKERLFKSKEIKQEPPKEDPTPAVDELLKKPYAELTANDADYKKYSAMLKDKVKNHGDAQSYVDANNTGYVLLKDDNAKDKNGLRVFKGAPA